MCGIALPAICWKMLKKMDKLMEENLQGVSGVSRLMRRRETQLADMLSGEIQEMIDGFIDLNDRLINCY